MSEKRVEKNHRTKEEKLRIIEECQKNGVTVTCNKYGIFPSSYYTWLRKYKQMGTEGLIHGMTREQQKEIRRLERENQKLRNVIAQQQLESAMKDELLKKKYQDQKRGKL
jgi:transposase-like protein